MFWGNLRCRTQNNNVSSDREDTIPLCVYAPGPLYSASSDGFTVTNAGFVDIEITSSAFEVGRMRDSGKDNYPRDCRGSGICILQFIIDAI